jgi:serine/threonine-protein kinase PpkA
MRVFLMSAVTLIFLGTSQVHAACSADVEAAGRELRDEWQSLRSASRRVVARIESYELRVLDLPADIAATLPPPPEMPQYQGPGIDADGFPEWTCTDDGGPAPAVAKFQAAFESYSRALDDVAERMREADALLVRAEDDAAPPVAEGEAVPEGDGGTAPDIAEAPDGEAPADPDAEGGSPGSPGEAATPEAVPEAEPDAGDAGIALVPLNDANNPGLFRRVISLPGTEALAEANTAAEAVEVPTFSVLYVFAESSANGKDWLQVGQSLREAPLGWVATDSTLPWSSMLVMQFAPRGQRSRVLFFEQQTMLKDIVNSFGHQAEAGRIYAELDEERRRMRDNPSAEPQWDDRLIAIEPETAVTFTNQPYLLPILDWREELFDGTVETTLLQVAAVPSEAESVPDRDTDTFTGSAEEAAMEDGEFRIGIVFVMDTTISMAPFIERTYETITNFYETFERFESAQYLSFGLVGFRDNVDNNREGIEYDVQVFQPLDPEVSPRSVLANMGRMTAADAPTIGFKEDAYAGLTAAIEETDWSAFDARLVILVTDASARTGNDPLARVVGTTAATLRERARSKNVAIVPIHLETPTNQRNGDFAIAQEQYRELEKTGDTSYPKYLAVDATSSERFAAEMTVLSEQVAKAVLNANAGRMVPTAGDVELEEIPDLPGEGQVGRLAAAVANEIFRAQLESLAKVGNGDAPAFLAGWAADRDLTDPDVPTLEVSVFLTRNQLSTLDQRLELIIDAYYSGGDDSQTFFDNLQLLAAEMSTDPDAVRENDREAIRTLLPSFLANLPYRSEVLRLNRDFWDQLSSAQKTEYIEALEAKRRTYRDIGSETDLWIDFGAADPNLEATPVRLTNLP